MIGLLSFNALQFCINFCLWTFSLVIVPNYLLIAMCQNAPVDFLCDDLSSSIAWSGKQFQNLTLHNFDALIFAKLVEYVELYSIFSLCNSMLTVLWHFLSFDCMFSKLRISVLIVKSLLKIGELNSYTTMSIEVHLKLVQAFLKTYLH